MIQAVPLLRPGADRPSDDWSGTTDPVRRRKLQNRCNQRAARRRKAAARFLQPEPVAAVDLTSILVQRAGHAASWLPTVGADHDDDDGSAFAAERHTPRDTFASIREALRCSPRISYAATVQQLGGAWSEKMYPLPADHLLSLIYYNVYRGMLQNIAILGLDLNLMTTDEYPSPFLPMSQTASSAIAVLPPHLMPTKLQKTVAHHPQWDIFPDAQVRDNVLNYGEERIDDLELCLDMVGSQSRLHKQSSDEAGAYLWGAPWCIDSWEVTKTFLRKYHWMFKGSEGFAQSTNHWRRQRGVKALDFNRVIEEAEKLSPTDESSPATLVASSQE